MMSRQTKVRFPVTKVLSKKKVNKFNCENDFDVENSQPKECSAKRSLFGSGPSPKKTKFDCENSCSDENTDFTSVKKNNIILCKQDSSTLENAKYVFHTSLPSRLVGRQKEMNFISSFLHLHLDNNKAGSLYISGAPGTGKTSSLMHVLNGINEKFSVVFINCMTISNSSMVYKKIADEIGVKCNGSTKSLPKLLEKHVTMSKVMTVLILDEIDHLDSKGQEVLYSLFRWPQLPNSTVILVGIANALDLTDRILPRLQTFNCKPTLMHFQPYTKDQIVDILKDRLSTLQDSEMIIKPMALQLCARKIAACTGDVRKALDVCRRAIEIMEKQTREQLTLKVSNDDRCNPGSPVKSTSPVKPVDLPQISAVLHEIYGSRVQLMNLSLTKKKADIVTLPLQQLLILCALVLVKKHVKLQKINLGKVYEVYRNICRKRQISDVSEAEFYSLCQLLETRGFVELKKNKIIEKLTKIDLKVEQGEIEHLFEDKALLSTILSDLTVVNVK